MSDYVGYVQPKIPGLPLNLYVVLSFRAQFSLCISTVILAVLKPFTFTNICPPSDHRHMTKNLLRTTLNPKQSTTHSLYEMRQGIPKIRFKYHNMSLGQTKMFIVNHRPILPRIYDSGFYRSLVRSSTNKVAISFLSVVYLRYVEIPFIGRMWLIICTLFSKIYYYVIIHINL